MCSWCSDADRKTVLDLISVVKVRGHKGRNCDKTGIPQIKKHEKDVQHPARLLVLSLSFLQQQEALVPLLPGSTCSLTHCQLRFPSGAQWGQLVHRHTGRHWGCLVERFDLLHFPPITTKNLFPNHLSEQQSQPIWFSFPFNFNGNKLLLWILFHFLCTETITVLLLLSV